MRSGSLYRFALGFFLGSAVAFLSIFVTPQWLPLAIVAGLLLLVGGLGFYMFSLVLEFSEDTTAYEQLEEPPVRDV